MMIGMQVKRQYSVQYLCWEVVLFCCGLGFLTILLHAPMQFEGHLLVVPLTGACWGAAIGGIWNNMLEGAKGGLLAGFGFLMLILGALSSR